MLIFNYCMFVLVFVVLSFQGYLPINPDGKPGLEPTLAFNTVAHTEAVIQYPFLE